MSILISVLDIAFLAFLLFVVDFYTVAAYSKRFIFEDALRMHPFFLISIFFVLFSIKNLAGFSVFRAQNAFIYGVASRISEKNLLSYLEGSYSEYVTVNSAVNTRKISQQPIEFSHYVLSGLLQIMTQTALIIFTITGMLVFDARLFFLAFRSNSSCGFACSIPDKAKS